VSGIGTVINNTSGAFVQDNTSTSGLTESEKVKLIDLWKFQGLDPLNPKVITTTTINVDDIDIELTGDGINNTTVTRI
jgi:hypothetical protein